MSASSIGSGRSVASVTPFRHLSANERQLIDLLRRDAPLSRAELARRTSLALPTVSRLADQLLRDGVLKAEDKVMMGRMGQPSLPLSLASHAAYAFGVAVRADLLTVSLAHLSGAIVAGIEEPHAGMTRDETVDWIGTAITSLVTSSDIPADRICGLGLALPGFFVDGPRRINAPLGMEDWATADLERDLGHTLGLPVIVENDGNAAALGEYIYGRGIDHPSLAYLYVDRGLGGGVVTDGVLLRGRRGNAGEFTGLLPPDARVHRPTLSLLHTLLADAGEHHAGLGEMVRAVQPRSQAVDRWIEQTAPTTEAIVSAIAAILDPDAIVIGGRLPRAVAERLIADVNFYSVPVRGRDRRFPLLLPSAVAGDAAALGASALCFQHTFL